MRRYTNEAVGRKVLDTLERRQRACVNACEDIPTDALYCHRCGCKGFYDETCAMAEVEDLLGIEAREVIDDE